MIVVIIAGGSGTRLWPLSTPAFPKHLLNINSDKLSLLQQTYSRAKNITDKVYVVSESGHIDHVKRQLPMLKDNRFIVEPARRGTANCIIAALAYIVKYHDKNEPVAFIHADHYIRDSKGFVDSFKLAEKVAISKNRVVLIGIEPDNPTTGFGYIEKGKLLSSGNLVYKVKSFKEKPDLNTAKEYLKSGNYLWNAGYFLGSINIFISNIEKFASELFVNYKKLLSVESEKYKELYLSFKPIAIDYALIEKMPNLLVAPATFDWMDLGSFSDLHMAAGGDDDGNYIHGNVEIADVQNTFIYNEEDKPIVVIGLDNVAIVNSSKGILVVRKDMSQKVGDVSKKIEK